MGTSEVLVTVVAGLLLPLGLALWRSHGKSWWYRWRRIITCGRTLPGPSPLPLLGNFSDFNVNTSDLIPTLFRLWEKFGSVLRIWMGPILVVNISDPRDLEVLLSSVKNIEKSYFYKFAHSWLGKGLLTSSGERWHKHRKLITPTFHFKILNEFVDIFNNQGNIFIDIMKQQVGKGYFDVCHMISLYTQDVITETAMGIQLNAQTDEAKVSEYLTAVRSEGDIMTKRLFSPWYYVDVFFNLHPLSWKEKKNLRIMHGLTRKVIAKRKKLMEEGKISQVENSFNGVGQKRRLAFLDLLLISAENDILCDKDIQEEVDTFMFEGHDTISSAISFALHELSKHPGIQEKIYEELRGVNFDDQCNHSMEMLNSLKYLEMVIKETLRLYPSVPLFGRILQEDMKLATRNEVLPSGVLINISPVAIHQNADMYPDPKSFNPDNFLPDVVQRRHPFAYLPFSAGPRNCIGQKFAMLEMKSIISKIIWNFKLEASAKFEAKLMFSVLLKAENGIELAVFPRERN